MAKEYLSRGPEILQDLQSRLEHAITNQGQPPKQAAAIALQITRDMCDAWGGQNIYFPKGKSFEAQLRDWQIFREFRGDNHWELAKKHDVTVAYIYHVVALCRKLHREKTQHSLLDQL